VGSIRLAHRACGPRYNSARRGRRVLYVCRAHGPRLRSDCLQHRNGRTSGRTTTVAPLLRRRRKNQYARSDNCGLAAAATTTMGWFGRITSGQLGRSPEQQRREQRLGPDQYQAGTPGRNRALAGEHRPDSAQRCGRSTVGAGRRCICRHRRPLCRRRLERLPDSCCCSRDVHSRVKFSIRFQSLDFLYNPRRVIISRRKICRHCANPQKNILLPVLLGRIFFLLATAVHAVLSIFNII